MVIDYLSDVPRPTSGRSTLRSHAAWTDDVHYRVPVPPRDCPSRRLLAQSFRILHVSSFGQSYSLSVTYPQILKSVTDGYVVRPDDIDFLGLDEDAVTSFCNHAAPLGMTHRQYSDFKTTLFAAIKNDGITKADVRLKGSSVEFFSGHHKMMPFAGRRIDRNVIAEEFIKGRKRIPTEDELNAIEAKLKKHWPFELHRPRRRPFDAFFKLGIAEEKSDYDVNISSDEIMIRVVAFVKKRKLVPTKALIYTKPYGFINKLFFAETFPQIEAWRRAQHKALGRPVTVAAFPGCGPPNVGKKIGPLSSHFRDNDWSVKQDD